MKLPPTKRVIIFLQNNVRKENILSTDTQASSFKKKALLRYSLMLYQGFSALINFIQVSWSVILLWLTF